MDDKRNSFTANWVAVALCAAAIVCSAWVSWRAVLTKSATTDEPLHALGAYVRWFMNDFRVNVEDPPLFGYWAMLGQRRDALRVDTTLSEWQGMVRDMWQQADWVPRVLYFTPGNDPDAFIQRSRRWMPAWGAALGVLVGCWSWRLAGPIAAVVAVILLSLDPNFIGHAPLVKNDVPMSLVYFASMFAAASVGRAVRWWNVPLLAVLVGVAANVKFSGLIVLPVVGVLLLIRAMLATPWSIGQRRFTGFPARLGLAGGIIVVCALSMWSITWLSYGMRYAATHDPSQQLNLRMLARQAAEARFVGEQGARVPLPPARVEEYESTPFIRTVLWLDENRLMPNAWSAGMLNTYLGTRRRRAFLLGEIRLTGWWYYFPLAMLFKTPTATLAAGALAAGVALIARRRGGVLPLPRWELLCILVPLGIYGLSALTTNLNLGLRHVLPLYPFLFVLIGVAATRAIRLRPRAGAAVGGALLLGLIVETAAAFPNYIAFFNTASGGTRNGINLLGDSNLDWGQDLLLLKRWQQQHPDVRLYGALFGTADPGYYVKYIPLPGNEYIPMYPQPIEPPGVAAISTNTLQGIYLEPELRAMYDRLRTEHEPLEILGGSIYLYDVADVARVAR